MHRPGRELVRMTPSTRDYFLFDDLLFDEHAQQEHDWLADILQNHLGVKIHYFETMLAEALAAAPAAERNLLITQVRQLESDMPPVEQRIGQLEVMVRWFQGQGWPQYTNDPEGEPHAAAPGSLPGSLASPPLAPRPQSPSLPKKSNRSPICNTALKVGRKRATSIHWQKNWWRASKQS